MTKITRENALEYHRLNGYVLAGRNLREVEIREAQTSQFAGITWLLAMIATLAIVAFGEFFLSEKR